MSEGPSSTAPAMAGPFLVGQLDAFDARLEDAGRRLLSQPADENAVHDLRVALRRTRTLLEIGRPVLGRFHVDEVRRALRDIQRVSGALRDEEVLLELSTSLVSARGADSPGAAASAGVRVWFDARRRRERRLRAALRRTIRDGELDRGRRLLAALVAFRIKPSRDKRLTKFARRAVEDARREVERRRGLPRVEAEALHRLRIAYKRLRYTAEAFASVLPPDLAALAPSAARFQNRLGRVHDVDMAIDCVKGAPKLVDDAREALLVELQRVRQDRTAAFELELGTSSIAPALPKATS